MAEDVLTILGELNKENNLTSFSQTDDGEIKDWYPSLLPTLDYGLCGGFPATMVSELAGKPSSGKSTMLGTVMKNAQKMGAVIVYYDVEGTQNASRLTDLGVDPSRVLTLQPTQNKDGSLKELSIEQIGSSIIDTLAKVHSANSNANTLFLWDSVAMTNSDMQADNALDQALVGQQAKALATIGRKIMVNLVHNNGTLIALNQARDDFNAPIAKYAQLKTVGGKGWEHLLSSRVTLQQAGKIKEKSSDTEPIGNEIRMKVVKSKVGDNWGSDFLVGLIGRWGFDFEYNLVSLGQELGLITTGRAPKYTNENGEIVITSNSKFNLIDKLKDPENEGIATEIWQREIKSMFKNCYPPLFNGSLFMHTEDFPMIKGLRAYYIKVQNSLDEAKQNYNFKHFMKLYNEGKLPDDIMNEVKEALK